MSQYLKISNDGKVVRGVTSKNISYVEIPFGVTEIGSFAFSYCRLLKEIIIPNSVIKIGSYSFDGCESLKSITIPDSVKIIEKDAFHCCEKVESVIIPNGVITIGDGAFSYCRRLSNIVIPKSVREIGEYAFSDTEWYRNQKRGVIYINDILYKVKEICPKTIIVKEGTRTIADGAFTNCTTLQNVIMPNSIRSIGYHSFDGCKSLKKISFPEGIEEIGTRAFADCTLLEEIFFPKKSNLIIGGDAFIDTKWLNETEDGAVYINDVLYKFKGDAIESPYIIEDGTKRIAPYAFYDCKGLQELIIPNSVTEIGWSAFENCSNLKKVSIPDSINKIEYNTFSGCTSLISVDIPLSVRNIDALAFQGCTSLQIIDVPNSVQEIGKNAFLGCSSLNSIDVPESVVSVGEDAFKDTKWFDDMPNGVVYLNKILYKLKGDVVDSYLIIKEGTICIAKSAFVKENPIHEIEIPNSIKNIGRFSFWGCKSLKTIHSHIVNIDGIVLEDAFDFTHQNCCTLVVPSGTRWAYRHHPFGGRFSEIEIENGPL